MLVGVDGSKVGLDKARRLAAERGVSIETVVTDLRDFEIERIFALAIVVFGFLALPWGLAGVAVAVTAAFFLFAVTFAIRAQRRKVVSGQEGLVGLTGKVRVAL